MKYEITKPDDATKDDNAFEVKIDQSNYKPNLLRFLVNFKERECEAPKYPQEVKSLIKNGYNVFHLSLLDMGKFGPNLRGFMSKHQKDLSRECW